MKASEPKRDSRRRLVWDEVVTRIDTAWGTLKLWKSGEIGGRSEIHHAELITEGEKVSEEVLKDIGNKYDLRHGDCVSASQDPRTMWASLNGVNKDQVFLGYTWVYWPSTD